MTAAPMKIATPALYWPEADVMIAVGSVDCADATTVAPAVVAVATMNFFWRLQKPKTVCLTFFIRFYGTGALLAYITVSGPSLADLSIGNGLRPGGRGKGKDIFVCGFDSTPFFASFLAFACLAVVSYAGLCK